jgi:hypothetical protein
VRTLASTAACVAAVIPLAAYADSGTARVETPARLTLSSGFDVSNGDYGAAEDTRIWVVPLSLRYASGSWRLSATASSLSITGPGDVVGGGDDGPIVLDPGQSRARAPVSGIGDVSLGATYALSGTGDWSVELAGRVKLPVAKASKGLGTGKADVSASLDVARSWGKTTPFVTVTYRLRGDPDGLTLRDGPGTSVGLIQEVGDQLYLLGSYDWTRASTRFSADSHELFGAVTGKVDSRWRWTLYGVAGLSDGSPNLGVGAQISVQLD